LKPVRIEVRFETKEKGSNEQEQSHGRVKLQSFCKKEVGQTGPFEFS
jgi:hypothetical protein